MSKYTREQLTNMATEVLRARLSGDEREAILVARISTATGLSARDVENRIELLAMGVPTP
jgi:hypothetical protein